MPERLPCKHDCGRISAKGRKECETCKFQRFKAKNEIIIIYYNLKNSARKRSLKFNLTKEWFVKFVTNSPLLTIRGRSAEAFTIDRVDNDKGYVMGNLEIITKSANSKKYWELYRQLTKGTVLEELEGEPPF